MKYFELIVILGVGVQSACGPPELPKDPEQVPGKPQPDLGTPQAESQVVRPAVVGLLDDPSGGRWKLVGISYLNDEGPDIEANVRSRPFTFTIDGATVNGEPDLRRFDDSRVRFYFKRDGHYLGGASFADVVRIARAFRETSAVGPDRAEQDRLWNRLARLTGSHGDPDSWRRDHQAISDLALIFWTSM